MGALDGAHAVVTGASRGIGLSIARLFVAAGARVVMLARTRADLEREALTLGARALDLPCDLADAADVEHALVVISERMGAPDILVNNAGAFALGEVGTLPGDTVQRLLAINLLAPYRLANAFVPLMRSRGTGHIVTIGSIADRHTYPENAAYAASKFGVRAVHQVMREELRGSGVRVSLVSPGPVDTPLWDSISPETGAGFTPRTSMLHADAVADAVLWVVTRPGEVNIDEVRLTHS
ncbi:MAG: SDR family NAD(P)-dependent oxidoreductase [Gemmatimonadaceae bacterium]|nr:SDR family NAD(P)-dependent oxidoreductase [Gemmatimonadaceae bacterium]